MVEFTDSYSGKRSLIKDSIKAKSKVLEAMGILAKPKEEKSTKIDGLKRFDYSMCRTLHKLGEGGFGVVRAAKILTEAPNKPAKSKFLGIPGRAVSCQSTDTDSEYSPPGGSKRAGSQKNLLLNVEKNTISSFNKKERSNSSSKISKDKGDKMYAIKIISKEKVVSTRQQEHMRNEL